MPLTAVAQKTIVNSRIITLQSTDKKVTSDLLKQSADIISVRLKQFGVSSFSVTYSADNGQVKVQLPYNIEASEIPEIEGLVSSGGKLAFYETYTQEEIANLLEPGNHLFKLLNHVPVKASVDPRVGCTDTGNRMNVNEYLSSSVSVRNCEFFWGVETEKSECCLFALKTNKEGQPLLVRSDVESVKIDASDASGDPKIQIKLKPAASSLFAEATKRNLNKPIAIVIDNQVYSWPVVRSVIEEGKIEITGKFSEKEIKYFPVLFNSEQLPLSFKLLK
jgi:SecD/SecF fusion protein